MLSWKHSKQATYLDSMDSAVVGLIAGCEKINGQRSDQRTVTVRLTGIPSVVAHMDDAVEGLLGGHAYVH